MIIINIRRHYRVAVFISGLLAVLSPVASLAASAVADIHSQNQLSSAFYFEENQGQFSPAVRFMARGNAYRVYLLDDQAVMVLDNKDQRQAGVVVIRQRLLGGAADARHQGVDVLPGRSYYYSGRQAQWQQNIPHYQSVLSSQVYPGIDLLYYSRAGRLEYDFIVAPGVSYAAIRYVIEGAEEVFIDAAGNLRINTAAGELYHHAPLTYQMIEQQKIEIASAFQLDSNNVVSFQVAQYDARYPLIIDPGLTFAAYLGGSKDDKATAIAADQQGNFYVTGQTQSGDFPAGVDAGFGDFQAGYAVFVSKFSKTGELLFTAYIGSSRSVSESDVKPEIEMLMGRGITVGDDGRIYITGSVVVGLNESMPVTTNSFFDCNAVAINDVDAFVAVLSASGSLDYFTCVGGYLWDSGEAIQVDSQGDIYVTGWTYSDVQSPDVPDFPDHSVNNLNYSGERDLFLLKLSPNGKGKEDLVFVTLWGGSGTDEGRALVLDSNGNIIVAGITFAEDAGTSKGMVLKFNPVAGAAHYALDYARKLNNYHAAAVATDADNAIYVAGSGINTDDAFVMKLNGTTGSLAADYAANPVIIGGAGGATEGRALVVDDAGDAYILGSTLTADLPGQEFVLGNEAKGGWDVFLSRINALGGVRYTVYLGGSHDDFGAGLATDSLGNVYISGITQSIDYAVYPDNGALSVHKGGEDVLLARIGPYIDLALRVSHNGPVSVGDLLTYSLTVINHGPDTATNIVLTDRLSTAVSYRSSQGCNAPVAGETLCYLKDLSAGQSTTVTITVAVDVERALINQADVHAGQFDFRPGNNDTRSAVDFASEAELETALDTSLDGGLVFVIEEATTETTSTASRRGGGAIDGWSLLCALLCAVLLCSTKRCFWLRASNGCARRAWM